MKAKTVVKNTKPKAKPKPRKSRSGTRRVTFHVQAEPGSHVAVSGDFNGWNSEGKKMTDKKGDGHYKVVMYLAPGIYEYKFIINETWCVDPECKKWIPNGLGTLNSVLHVEAVRTCPESLVQRSV